MIRKRRKQLQQASPAQALVEFALIATVLLMIIFIIIESARILWGWNTVQNAAREGARYAITGQSEGECPFGDGTKFTEDDGRDVCDVDDGFRVASIINRAHKALSGLPLNENSVTFEDDNYYNIEVWGQNEDLILVPDFGGEPTNYVVVRVYYQVPIITPLLRPIARTVPVFGQVTLNNEAFGQLSSNNQPQALPPPVPNIPTPGVTPSPTPTPTQTNTPTPGPSPTATHTATATSTAAPELCPVRFEGSAVAGNTHVLVSGEVGSTVTIIDVDTGTTLGSATLIAIPGHGCEGFADFIPPVHSALSEALTEGHLLLAISDDGSFDETFVLGSPPTETPTSTNTPPPSPTPSNTPTATPTHTPSDPYITLLPNCGNNATVSFTILGFNWPADEDITLWWDGTTIGIVDDSQHNGSFSRTFTLNGVLDGTHLVEAIAQFGTTATADFIRPCEFVTPTPSTATPTSTPRPVDLVMISAPDLVNIPPINAYEPVDFSVVITNTGDIDVNQQFFVDLYFDPIISFPSYIPISQSVGFSAVSGLPGGASRVITITAPLGFANEPDPHTAYGMVDSLNAPLGGQIGEAIETNNVSNPAIITDVIDAATPTPTPTFDPSGTDFISGIVQSRIVQWVPQARALVTLVDSSSRVVGITRTDTNGFYEFQNVPDDTYTVFSCIDVDGIGFFGMRTGITPPNSLANIYMRPGLCSIDPPTNNLPSVTNPGNQVNNVGDTVDITIAATDADGDTLTFSATGLPPGLTIDPNTGQITGTLPQDSQGIYSVAVSVFDGTGSTNIFFSWTVVGLRLETFTVSNVNSSGWKTVNLTNSYNSMVAVCTVHYKNNSKPEVVRMQNASGNSFQIRLQNPSSSSLGNETVHCIVMEEGVWTLPDGRKIEAHKMNSTVTDRKGSWTGQAQTYGQSYTSPVILGQVMTYNDTRWSTFWSRGGARNAPPNGTTLRVGKHIGEDTDTARAVETVGYIVIEGGNGSIGGTEYEVALGNDTVVGVGNTAFVEYTFNQAFSSTPAVAILSQAAMDGNDGSWTILSNATPLTTTKLRLIVDEDQIKNSERKHTTEQVGYAVFGDPLILTGTE